MRHACVLLGISVALGAGACSDGRLYKGKPLSHWKQQLSDLDPKTRVEAVVAVATFGADGLEPLVGALKDENSNVRTRAAMALGGHDEAGPAAVPALLNALNDQVPAVRQSAAFALGSIKWNAEAVVPALSKALGDPANEVRSAAAAALGLYGPAARAAVPALETMASNGSYANSSSAKRALARISGNDASNATPE